MLAKNPEPQKRSRIFTDIENWRSAYQALSSKKNQSAASVQNEKNIIEMIDRFEQFCFDYTRMFYDKTMKVEDASFHADWLESTIEKVLLGYWDPIVRAAEQYQIGYYKKLLDVGYSKLEESKLGRKSIGLDKPIVLYLEKTGVYKRYPFGDIFLIGIPLIDAYNEDWNAMWHELGHHLYWNSRINFENRSFYQGRVDNAFDQLIEKSVQTLQARDAEKDRICAILKLWAEEIFADVIGTKIAGAEFVDAGWKKISREVESWDELFRSDAKHPSPYVLPYIRAFIAGEQFMVPQATWEQRFGRHDFTALRNSKNNDYILKIENLLLALKMYCNQISQRLDVAQFESWFSGSSALDELVGFVKKDHPEYTPVEMAKALLKPQIMEGGAEWICGNAACGKANSSIYISEFLGVEYVGDCQYCHTRTWFPYFKPS